MDEIKCAKCDATMKSKQYLDDNGVCQTCITLGILSKKEKQQDPNEKENEGRLKNVIAKEVDNILSKYGILITCDCGNMFYKRSPAQKTCGECKTK